MSAFFHTQQASLETKASISSPSAPTTPVLLDWKDIPDSYVSAAGKKALRDGSGTVGDVRWEGERLSSEDSEKFRL